ncbi:hypothetical protein M5K25_012958 [Dendrobium thyrsiflorum]|uniref:Uncharacterized protein n=1 Tax=Dendrobium thyrsiflorum TaxID=117978 RepID=A0ABD0V5G4_DENTH
MHVFFKRGGKGTRCGAYDEADKTPFSGPSRPSTKKFHPPRYEAYYEPDPLSTSRRSRQGSGTCPLTGGFAAKWHRRINGYDPGPYEPSDSPPNGVTILRRTSNPGLQGTLGRSNPWLPTRILLSVSAFLKVWGDVSDSDY